MPRSAAAPLLVALGVVATLGLASCGGGEARLLPGETARQITANLDTVKQLAGEGNCAGAASAARQVSEQVEALGGVDAKLKQALREGAARLNQVVAGCEATTTEATVPTEAETTTEKPKGKEKPKKEKAAPATPEATTPSLPPQANGKGKGQGSGNAPPGGEAEAPSSGGVGAGEAAGEGH